MINQEQLNAIKERVAKTTPGPWLVEESRYEGRFNAASADENYDLPACLMGIEDAEFVTHAREDVPALVAEVEYLRGMLRVTRKIVRHKVSEVKTLQNACKNHKAKQEALVIENERLSETLCFYGDLSKYVIIAHMNKETDLAVDLGEKARQALGGKAHE
ncbi:hypothetical protein NXZ77_21465 [Lysinibacillus boronitolerans]|uniref:hypothetical protein n=1 Tax=Lysinibacillus boronitolerans TaxID=309788 RepID=UPI0021610FD7|nr:hypothetical protein [Lysinibacillus boronitolerans]MCS1394146.1 hypothetical protein [Lysinibacillus boronitolerans]